MSVRVSWRKESDSYMKEHAREMGVKGDSNIFLAVHSKAKPHCNLYKNFKESGTKSKELKA